MPSDQSDTGGVARIVFRQILEGDRLKFIAQSNISDTGGGARDLRFRNWDRMETILRKLFPQVRDEGRRGSDEVYVGRLTWLSQGKEVSKEALLEPPTKARPNEARITRVHEYDCFKIEAPDSGSGRLVVLFIQKNDGSVWPFIITEHSLEHDGWDPVVADFLLSALNAQRPERNAAYGYIDFESDERFVR